jgi:geranylgeranyl diphosphate synthase type II
LPPAEAHSATARSATLDDLLSEYLHECKELIIAEIRTIIPSDGRYGQILYNLMLDYPLRDAKGLRPMLSIASCRALGGKLEAVLRSAAVLELYHNAFLIHDDVEDQSVTRRGKPTLHRLHGVPIAVNVGDAMLCLSLQPLLENMSVIGLGPSLRILQAVARMTRESVEGQALELDWVRRERWDLTDDDYVRMVEQKTSWYSFITPLTIGGITAAVERECLDSLTEFGRCLGIAFQIQDDVLSLRGQSETFGKEIGGDLWEGKRTLILLHMMRSASAAERAEAERILALPQPSRRQRSGRSRQQGINAMLKQMVIAGELTDNGYRRLRRATLREPAAPSKNAGKVRRLFELIDKHGSIDYAASVARRWASEAQNMFETRVVPWMPRSIHRDVLQAVVEYVHQRRR